jgi:hypothetical protein
MTQQFIKTNGSTFAAVTALTIAGAASAAIDPSKYVGWDYWTGTGPAGYTDFTGAGAGDGGALLSVQTDCGPFGCFTLPQATGLGAITVAGSNNLKGFVRFQFENFNYVNYTGMWFWLQFQYTPTGGVPTDLTPGPTGQQQSIINAVNGQTYGLTGTSVTAHTAQTASQQTGAFSNFLPSSMSNTNNIFFNWYPTPSGPVNDPLSGRSQVFVFAWDFTNVSSIAGNSTWGISGAGAVPAPGAIALLGLGGLIGSGRRRRS